MCINFVENPQLILTRFELFFPEGWNGWDGCGGWNGWNGEWMDGVDGMDGVHDRCEMGGVDEID